MPTASERSRELPPGPELDALFFETCWGWYVKSAGIYEHVVDQYGCHWPSYPKVTADGSACEAWVMRWLTDAGISWRIEKRQDSVRVDTWGGPLKRRPAPNYGRDWKHALTLAAIAAKEAMKGERDGN